MTRAVTEIAAAVEKYAHHIKIKIKNNHINRNNPMLVVLQRVVFCFIVFLNKSDLFVDLLVGLAFNNSYGISSPNDNKNYFITIACIPIWEYRSSATDFSYAASFPATESQK